MAIRITGNFGRLMQKAIEAGTIEELAKTLIRYHDYGQSGEHSIGCDLYILDAEKEDVAAKLFGAGMEQPPFLPKDDPPPSNPGGGGLVHWPDAEGDKWTINT